MAGLFRGVAKRAAAMGSAAKSSSAAKTATSSPKSFASKSCSASAAAARRWSLSQAPRLGCAESLLPLHSAVAAARMTSCLTSASRNCRALSQELGLAVPR